MHASTVEEGMKDMSENGGQGSKVTIKDRIKHFTWAQFTLPLSTSGIALLLAGTPHRFDGLTTIGKIFFIFALVQYVAAIAGITTRFILFPAKVHCAFFHPTESLFYPTSVLSLANLISCAQIYGAPYCGPWYPVAMRVLFWLYMAIALISATLQYLSLFSAPAQRLTIQSMTPAWLLPVFQMLLAAVTAGIIAPGQSPSNALTVIVGGATFLGVGWMVAIFMFAAYIQRLMHYGLPAPNLRPGMFIAVGPPSFTGLALINLAQSLFLVQGHDYFSNPKTSGISITTLQTLADWSAIFLWTLALFFFFITTLAVLGGVRKMSFHLVWWALVFPNIAFALVTGRIGERLESQGIMGIGSALTVLLVIGWIFVIIMQGVAVWRKDILMPGKDEDKGTSMPWLGL